MRRLCLFLALFGCDDDHSTTEDAGVPDLAVAVEAGPTDGAFPDADMAPGDSGGGEPEDMGGPADVEPSTPDLAPADVGVAAEGWSPAPPVEAGPIQEVAVVAVGTRIYVLGGFNDVAQVTATVSVYNTSTGRWSRGADLPARMHHANAAAVDGRIYVLGFLTGFDFVEDGRGFVYDPASDSWSDGPQMPAGTQRGASGVAVVGSRIYLLGGLAGRRAVERCNGYDVESGEWFDVPPLPRIADHMAAGGVAGRVVVAGGRTGAIEGHTSETHIYVPGDAEWTAGAPMPTARGGVAAAVEGGRLYVMGGEGNPADGTMGVFPNVEAYDVEGDEWFELDPMPTPRHGTGAAAVDGVIYVPGGATRQAFGAVDDHERLRP